MSHSYSIPNLTFGIRQMPTHPISPRVAARVVNNDLLLDAVPALNLAGFATTYMEREIEELMLKNLPKNITHEAVYPAANLLEKRCIEMIASLFHIPQSQTPSTGVSTAGSSEAIFLAVLAAKRRWQHRCRELGRHSSSPNIVISTSVHVSWKKAARYLELEERYCDCSDKSATMDPQQAADLVDENTILVCCVLGSCYTGEYDDIAAIDELLQHKNSQLGTDVGIHVDAASGGFVAPFLQPDFVWDFRLPLVSSINVSGHKYGQTYASVGWAIWRSSNFLPHDLIFSFDYCGSDQVSFNVNFSQAAAPVVGQYYQLIRLGREGFTNLMKSLMDTADYLAEQLASFANSSLFVLMNRPRQEGLPLVAWKLQGSRKYDEFDIAMHLKLKGWIVPAFTMHTTTGTIKLLRIIVKVDFNNSACNALIADLGQIMDTLESGNGIMGGSKRVEEGRHRLAGSMPIV